MSRKIRTHLSKTDPVMAALIGAVGAYALEPPEDIHPFQALAHAIAHQQLNGTAANTILRRLIESCGKGSFPSPQCVLDASVESLRAAGFSYAKVAALKDLAAKTLESVVPGHAELALLSNEEIIARLTTVRGIGRWTVEMLLMFRLGRPDVLPVDDFGVRAGFRAAYALRSLPHPKALAAFGERWKPYRSAAAWYLWRALELQRAGTLPAPPVSTRLPRLPKRRRRSASSTRKKPKSPLRRASALRRKPRRRARK